jgi:hypothetical protein
MKIHSLEKLKVTFTDNIQTEPELIFPTIIQENNDESGFHVFKTEWWSNEDADYDILQRVN